MLVVSTLISRSVNLLRSSSDVSGDLEPRLALEARRSRGALGPELLGPGEMKGGRKYDRLISSENLCQKTQPAGARFSAVSGLVARPTPCRQSMRQRGPRGRNEQEAPLTVRQAPAWRYPLLGSPSPERLTTLHLTVPLAYPGVCWASAQLSRTGGRQGMRTREAGAAVGLSPPGSPSGEVNRLSRSQR
jgi:hypothetical protein